MATIAKEAKDRGTIFVIFLKVLLTSALRAMIKKSTNRNFVLEI